MEQMSSMKIGVNLNAVICSDLLQNQLELALMRTGGELQMIFFTVVKILSCVASDLT